MSSTRAFDLVLQGATGFTGHLATEELHRRAPDGFRWAIAGRDSVRTQSLADRFGVEALCVDGMDPKANDGLASRTRVVLSCAGPFTRYGRHLVDACVAHGTHYADISGELPWIADLIERHHATSRESGTVILPASGFDSVPTDLAVQAMRTSLGKELPIRGFYTIRGGFNGGTLHSGIALAEDFGPEGIPRDTRSTRPFPIPSLNRWATPFLMAPVNEAVVARSRILGAEGKQAWEEGIPYLEWMAVRGRLRAQGYRCTLAALGAMFRTRIGRSLLRRLGPDPGNGPSEQDIRNGFARLHLIAGPLGSPVAERSWHWDGDPSNRITVRCLVQTGLALAAGEAEHGGVLTPATALGDRLLRRLLAIRAVAEVPLDRPLESDAREEPWIR